MADDGLRDRLARQGEDALGKLAQDLLENPLVNGAISRAFSAREHASQAQEAALGALNIPSAADVERLTRRLRSVSQRLEGIEDGVDRLDARIATVRHRRRTSTRAWTRSRRPSPSWPPRSSLLSGAVDARAPVPREQERLEVDKPAAEAGSQAREEVELAERRRRDRPDRALGGLELLERRSACSVATTSLTASTHPAVSPAALGHRDQRRELHLHGDRPGRRPALVAARVRVVEQVGGDDQALARRRRPPRSSAACRPGRGAASRSRRAPGWCRPRRARRRRPGPAPSSRPSAIAPHVPTRTNRRAPSSISSSTTIAVLGPPIPVLWIVSGSPSGPAPV